VSADEIDVSHANLGLIESALEVFPSSLHPVEDYEGYAVRRLLLALRTRLTG